MSQAQDGVGNSQTTSLLLDSGKGLEPFRCAIHGTVTRCPFRFMDCTDEEGMCEPQRLTRWLCEAFGVPWPGDGD